MKLLLRRTQKSSMMGKITFGLDVRAQISDEEKANVKKYKLGDTMLYEREQIVGGSGLLGMASKFALNMMNISISVNDLENGKVVECKNIMEMLAVEEQIKEAAHNFKNVLEAAAHFGGEEVITIE
jgi:F420-0:gamma-glutamyl ligase-like protein